MEPTTSRSVVKYFTDWANKKLALIINNFFIVGQLSLMQDKNQKLTWISSITAAMAGDFLVQVDKVSVALSKFPT